MYDKLKYTLMAFLLKCCFKYTTKEHSIKLSALLYHKGVHHSFALCGKEQREHSTKRLTLTSTKETHTG